MQPTIPIFRPLETFYNLGRLVELPFFDGNIDPDDILPHYPTGTYIQVSMRPPPSV
jgi:hypothetical protein